MLATENAKAFKDAEALGWEEPKQWKAPTFAPNAATFPARKSLAYICARSMS
jgi:hypothetical protein